VTEPRSPDDAEARTQHDPVLFGPDPFAGHPGGPLPGEQRSDEELPRPRWPVVVGILILVVLLVGALGIWVF